jgi:hypothetical protein
MNIEQSDAPISGLQMMSHAAEATSALLGTPPAKELPIVSSAIPSQDDIIDLVTSPLKRCPPWNKPESQHSEFRSDCSFLVVFYKSKWLFDENSYCCCYAYG